MTSTSVDRPASAVFALKRIWREGRATPGFTSLILFSLIAALLNSAVILPVSMQIIIGHLQSEEAVSAVYTILAISLTLLMVGYGAEWIANRHAAMVNGRICLRLTDEQVEGYLRSSLATFQNQPSEQYSAAVGEVAEGLQTHQLFVLQTGVLSVGVTLISLIVLAQYNFWFLAIMLPFLIAICGLPMMLAKRAGTYLEREPAAFGALGNYVEALEEGRRDWYFAPTENLLAEADRILDQLHHSQTGKWWIWNLSFNLKLTQNLILNALTLLVGGLLFLDGRIDLGTAAGSYLLVSMIAPKFDGLYKLYNFAQASAAAYNALDRSKLDAAPRAAVVPAGDEQGAIRTISLEVSGFRHPAAAHPVIKQAQLHLASGDKCLIIGPSGSGKSTLVDLLLGSLDGPEVRLSINGEALSDYGRENYWRDVAYVPNPDLVLGGISAEENLRLFGEPCDLSESNWPDALGWARFAKTRGDRLSGGEKQRLSLLRAMSCGRGLVVLDEPTSALDDDNTRKAFEMVTRASDAILVVISHSAGASAHFDRVFEMQAGNLVEQK